MRKVAADAHEIRRQTILEQMHGVRREQANRSERKTGKAKATCEPSERHHAGDDL